MNKEIKYLLEEMEDNTQDYVGTNGCLYQDLLREELNLLLDYISNLQNQVKKQKEVIDKAVEYVKNNLIVSSILDGKKYYCLNNYGFNYKELLEILENKEVSE